METTAKFDIKGKGVISMELKNIEEIENCPAGTIITLNEYTGVFVDFDDDIVRLKPINGKYEIGLKVAQFTKYWEQI